uniref:Uncharacterized protein n=1 Tax=Schistocephalus solidus TaxID=70667 RepID=A0A0X3NQV9_SCHSO
MELVFGPSVLSFTTVGEENGLKRPHPLPQIVMHKDVRCSRTARSGMILAAPDAGKVRPNAGGRTLQNARFKWGRHASKIVFKTFDVLQKQSGYSVERSARGCCFFQKCKLLQVPTGLASSVSVTAHCI